MTRKSAIPPITTRIQRLRQRQRTDGTWRVWWEPRPEERAHGLAPVELDPARPTWSAREAERLNRRVAEAIKSGARPGRRSSRTIDDLIRDYEGSVHFTERLKPATQASYKRFFRLISRKWGAYPAAGFDKPAVHTWYQTLYRTKEPRTAQAMVAHLSILLGHAELIGWRAQDSNPCTRIKIMAPKRRSRAASWDELDALLAAAEGLGLHGVALAIRLSVFQGQRQTDILAATRGAFGEHLVRFEGDTEPRRRWLWLLRRSKRGTEGGAELHPETIGAVQAALATRRIGDRMLTPTDALIWDERVGRPYDTDLFAKRWAAVRQAAIDEGWRALATLQFRDLRRTFGVLARRGGATPADVGDVLGNTAGTDPQLQEIYMPPQVETASRAVGAIKRPTKDGRKKA